MIAESDFAEKGHVARVTGSRRRFVLEPRVLQGDRRILADSDDTACAAPHVYGVPFPPPQCPDLSFF